MGRSVQSLLGLVPAGQGSPLYYLPYQLLSYLAELMTLTAESVPRSLTVDHTQIVGISHHLWIPNWPRASNDVQHNAF